MRKLSIVLLVGLMLIGGMSLGVYAQVSDVQEGDATADVGVNLDANTIAAIYIPSAHTSVNLGTIGSGLYDSANDSWSALTDGNTYTVKAYTNSTSGLTVSVSASTSSIDSLADLQIKTSGGDPSGDFVGLDSDRNLVSTSEAGLEEIDDIQYQYMPDFQDNPGSSYSATLTYTVSSN